MPSWVRFQSGYDAVGFVAAVHSRLLTLLPGHLYTSYVVLVSMAGLRMTVGVLAVLGALLDRPGTELYGLEIVRASGLEPGTIYPILQRLRAAGWVSDRWEDGEPAHTEGRPPRRYYRLTTEGCARASHALQHGRDRSGLGRLLAPPRLPAVPSSEAGPA
jgi:PadR family transcriptional regulator